MKTEAMKSTAWKVPKYRPEKTPYLDTFRTVESINERNIKQTKVQKTNQKNSKESNKLANECNKLWASFKRENGIARLNFIENMWCFQQNVHSLTQTVPNTFLMVNGNSYDEPKYAMLPCKLHESESAFQSINVVQI